MKRKMFIAALLGAILGSLVIMTPAQPAAADLRSCSTWLELPEEGRATFVLGWMLATDAMEILDYDISSMWPEGHRVSSVVTELNVQCKETPRMLISHALITIAQRLNRLDRSRVN